MYNKMNQNQSDKQGLQNKEEIDKKEVLECVCKNQHYDDKIDKEDEVSSHIPFQS